MQSRTNEEQALIDAYEAEQAEHAEESDFDWPNEEEYYDSREQNRARGHMRGW